MLTFKEFINEAKWSGRLEHSVGSDNHGFIKAYEGDKEVGRLEYKHHPKLNRLDVWMIRTHPEYQRKGIATTIMNAAKEKYPGVKLDWGTKTFDGLKFVRKYEPEEETK